MGIINSHTPQELTNMVIRDISNNSIAYQITFADCMINALKRKIDILQDAKKFGTRREEFYKLFGWSKKQIEFKFDCEFGRIDGHGIMFHMRYGEIININEWKKEIITPDEIKIVRAAKRKLNDEYTQRILKKM